jgi:5'-3' exonuclease
MRQGNQREADKQYARAIDVTPEMASEVINEMQGLGIECIVAPYEADAQLAYLSQQGYVSAVISADSDLLVFNCPKVIYKLDVTGQCVEIAPISLQRVKEFSGLEWSHDRFIKTCILSGCDYARGLKGIGVKTAAKLLARTEDLKLVLSRVKLEYNIQVPQDYEDQFSKAFLCFKHQRVYCPSQRQLVHLTELSPSAAEFIKEHGDDFLGPLKSPHDAVMIAEGKAHPETHKVFSRGLKRNATLDSMFASKKRAVVLQTGAKIAVPMRMQSSQHVNPVLCEVSSQPRSRSKFFVPRPTPPTSIVEDLREAYTPEMKVEEEKKPSALEQQAYSALTKLEALAYKPIYRIGLRAPSAL